MIALSCSQKSDSADQHNSLLGAQQTEDISVEDTKPILEQTEASAAANVQHPELDSDAAASKEAAPQQSVQDINLASDAEKPDQVDGSDPDCTPLPVPEADLSRNAQAQQETHENANTQTKEYNQDRTGDGAAAAASLEEPTFTISFSRLTQDLEGTHIGSEDNTVIEAEQACSNKQRSTSAEEPENKSTKVIEAAETQPEEAVSSADVNSGKAEATQIAMPAAAASSASAEEGEEQ